MSVDRVEAAPGVEGNARLTSTTGSLLIILLAVEGLTILAIRQMITLHIYLGTVLVGPMLLKVAVTTYKFARYYGRSDPYRRNGPPHLVLRVLGPLVVLSSLAVLGTGVALLAVSPERSDGLLTAHQTCFIIWLIVTGLHVLGHLKGAVQNTVAELRPAPRDRPARAHRLRIVVIAVSLILGVAAATTLLPAATPWTHAAHAHHADEN